MNFEIRPISSDAPPKKEEHQKNYSLKQRKGLVFWWKTLVEKFGLFYVLLFFILGVTAIGLAVAYSIASSIEPKFERPTYVEQAKAGDRINVLILGVAGATEQGGYLTDSIMVASISQKSGKVTMISIPRDTWVKSSVGNRKINSVYSTARSRYDRERALTISKNTVEGFLGHPIHHAAVVDFEIFEAIIDELGGLDIFVEKTINDPYYPAANYGYQRFYIAAGQQNIDGATALKYARSRQTTSDFDRARRQQEIIYAIKEKALNLKLLTDFNKLGKIFGIYEEYVNTDLSAKDIIKLAKIGIGIEKEDITQTVLNDEPGTPGGLLMQGAKQFYGGQFVLVPFDEDETQEFFDLLLAKNPPMNEAARIEVYNATSTPGIARQVGNLLTEYGFNVTKIANYDEEVTLSPGNYVELLTKSDVLETFDYLKLKYKAKERTPERNQDILADIKLILNEVPKITPPPRPVVVPKAKTTPKTSTNSADRAVTPITKPQTNPSATDEAAENAKGL